MTNERKKAVLYLVLTLVFGILIGALIPGFFGRFHEGGRMRDQRGGGLTHIISRVVKPDSVQATRIKPIIAQTASRIEGLQNGCNQEVKNPPPAQCVVSGGCRPWTAGHRRPFGIGGGGECRAPRQYRFADRRCTLRARHNRRRRCKVLCRGRSLVSARQRVSLAGLCRAGWTWSGGQLVSVEAPAQCSQHLPSQR